MATEETREERRRAEWLRRNAELRERNPFIHHAQQIFLYNRYRIGKAINPEFEDWRITDVDLNTGEYLTPNLRAIREFYSTNRTEAIRSKIEDRFVGAFETQREPSMLPDAVVEGNRPVGYDAYEQRLFDAESYGGRSDAQSETSSAAGMYQMTEGTYRDLQRGLDDDDPFKNLSFEEHKADPEAQRHYGRRLQELNMQGLKNRGVPATAQNMYAAHHFGITRALGLVNSESDRPVSQVLTRKQMRANPALFGRGGLGIRTVGELNEWIAGKMGDIAQMEVSGPMPPFEPDFSIDMQSMSATPGGRMALIPGAMQGPETLQ